MRAAVLPLLLLLSACASSGGPPPRGDRGPLRAAACAPLFISPAGEPFRAGGEAAGCPLDLWFAGADADRDGALTRTEFRGDALRFFAVLDADRNGAIDGVELQRYERVIVPEILGLFGAGPGARADAPRLVLAAIDMQSQGGMGQGGLGQGGMGGGAPSRRGGGPPGGGRGFGGPGGGGVEGAARFGLLAEPEPVAAADLDLNGRITRAEFAARADQRFRTLDTADTGRLLLDDLRARLRQAGPPRLPGGGQRPSRPPRRGPYGGVDGGISRFS